MLIEMCCANFPKRLCKSQYVIVFKNRAWFVFLKGNIQTYAASGGECPLAMPAVLPSTVSPCYSVAIEKRLHQM